MHRPGRFVALPLAVLTVAVVDVVRLPAPGPGRRRAARTAADAPYQAEVEEGPRRRGRDPRRHLRLDEGRRARRLAAQVRRRAARRSRRCSTPPTRSSPSGPTFPIKIGIYSFSSGVRTLRPIQPVRSRRDPRARWRSCRGRAAARRSARRCARRGRISIAPACSASTCWSSPTARTPAAAARTRSRARSSRKSEGAVQVYFVAFDTSPEKFAFLKEVGGDVIGAGTGAELRTALDGIYQGKILAEAAGARRAGTGQEVISSYCMQRSHCDSSQVLVGLRRADQQGRQHVLGGRPDRADALRVRPAVEQLKEGRGGLEQYRGLVERVTRQVVGEQVARAEARGRDQGLPEGRRSRDRRQVRARAAEGQGGAGRQRGAAADARDGVRQQPEEDPARQREADRAAREDHRSTTPS